MCSEGPKAVFELEHGIAIFLEQKMEEFIKDHLEASLKDFGKGGQAARMTQLLTELDMRCFIHFIKIM